MEFQKNQTNGKKYHCSRNTCFVRRIRKLLLVRFYHQGHVRCGLFSISFSNSSTDRQSITVRCRALNKNIENKRLKIDIGILREMLHKQEISSIEWIDSDKQLADPLTKGGASSNKLIEALNGTVKICQMDAWMF